MKTEELPYHPVAGITWFEACSFCQWLANSFPWARGARLPTEEEWEYACRAGSQSCYWSGDEEVELATVGWYGDNSGLRIHRVGEKPASPWGLYDVHGNIWEWTLNPLTDNYAERKAEMSLTPAAVEIPVDESPGDAWRKVCGGCFWDDAVRANAAFRRVRSTDVELVNQGFRVVLPAGLELDRRSSIIESPENSQHIST